VSVLRYRDAGIFATGIYPQSDPVDGKVGITRCTSWKKCATNGKSAIHWAWSELQGESLSFSQRTMETGPITGEDD